MAQLYRHLFDKKIIGQRLKLSKSPSTAQIIDKSVAFVTKHAPDNSAIILYRLPKAELQFLAVQPCFVKSSPENSSMNFKERVNMAQIKSSKLLRKFTHSKEETACSRCSFVKECPFSNKRPEDDAQASLSDILVSLAGLYRKETNEMTKADVGIYTAASTVLSTTSDILEDFEMNNGIEFKMLLNELK